MTKTDKPKKKEKKSKKEGKPSKFEVGGPDGVTKV